MSFNKLGVLADIIIHPDFGVFDEFMKQLYFSDCSLKESFLPGFLQTLQKLPKLKHLDLSFNQHITGLKSLTKCISFHCKQFKELNLEGCGIKDLKLS